MSSDISRLQHLAQKWLSGTITEEEKKEFIEWYNNADDTNPLHVPKEFATDEITHGQRMFESIYRQIQNSPSASNPSKTRSISTGWLKYAAAVIIITLGVAAYFVLNTDKQQEQVSAKTAPTKAPAKDVEAPAGVYAMITLDNGKSIVLDSAGPGLIATQDNVELKKLSDGQIVYSGNSTEQSFNMLTNPRGSKVIEVTLADGTRVWLNSESSIRYPTSFTGTERVVEVKGETYFEVAKDASKPFKVKKGDMEIVVLGTYFNVNAYEEEKDVHVTLLEGRVQVSNGGGKLLRMMPGEQSRINANGSMELVKNVDTDGVMAWKNGRFDFGEKTELSIIMRQLARWYNLEIEYKGTFTQHFGGSISRYVNLSQVLKVLETSGVKFEVSGNKVTVLP